MVLYTIAVKYVTPALAKKLGEGLLYFEKTGWDLDITEAVINDWAHVLCKLSAPENDPAPAGKPLISRILADNLTGIIMEEQAVHYLEELVDHYYFYFPRPERYDILCLAEKNYESDRAKEAGGQLYSEVCEALRTYLEGGQYLNLHGFIVFRLRPWLEFLRQNVDRAVDEFLLEKEYQEFIKLLKYFVALQEPKINEIHVTLDEDGNARMLDQYGQPVDRGQDGIQWDGYDSVADGEDRLVSMLITAAPHRVILHKQVYTQYPKAVDTLKHVFDNRVTICKRCKLCQDESSHLTLKGK